MTIRARLCVAFLLVVALGFYRLVAWILDDLRPRYLESLEASMVDTSTLLASFLSTRSEGGALDLGDFRAAFTHARARRFRAKIYDVTKTRMDLRVYVIARDGRVLFDSDGRDEGKDFSRWNDVIRTLRGEYGARATRLVADDPASAILHVAAPILRNGEIAGVLAVVKASSSVDSFLRIEKRKIAVAGALAALAVAFLGIGLSVWLTRPIHALAAYARAVRDGGKPPFPRLGRNEFAELGAAFEEMRDALEGKRYVENYVQALTHEMKSPLSAIRGAAELLEEDPPPPERARFLRNIRAENERIQDLVDRMMTLAALEGRKALRDVEPIDVAALLRDVADSLEPLWTEKGIDVRVDASPEARAPGERFPLRQSLANALQNAIEFSPRGGRIEMSAVLREGRVTIRVADQGPGVPEYALPRVFDRFYSLERPDTHRRGTGLGLAFVREAMALHGGAARIENRHGGGPVLTLDLPARLETRGR